MTYILAHSGGAPVAMAPGVADAEQKDGGWRAIKTSRFDDGAGSESVILSFSRQTDSAVDVQKGRKVPL